MGSMDTQADTSSTSTCTSGGYDQTQAGGTSLIDKSWLVSRLMDPNDTQHWPAVEKRYGARVESLARHRGLRGDWVAEARQRTMAAFAINLRAGKFDESRGRLRDYLFGIAYCKIVDLIKEIDRSPHQIVDETGRSGFFERSIEASDRQKIHWDIEWDKMVAEECLKLARREFTPLSYETYRRRVILGQPSAEVAAHLGKTTIGVDTIVSKVRRFLSQVRPEVERMF